MAISLHSLLALLFSEKELFSWWTMLLTHAVCWGLPVGGAVFVLAADAVGSSGHSFCFIRGELDEQLVRSRYVRKWILFSGPVMGALVAGLLCLLGLLLNLRKIRADRAASRMRLRVLLFAAAFTVLYGVVVIYEFVQTINAPTIKHEQQQWARCVVLAGPAGGCAQRGRINLYMYWAFLIVIQLQGIILLLLFGTTQSMLSSMRTLLAKLLGRSGEAKGDSNYVSFTAPIIGAQPTHNEAL